MKVDLVETGTGPTVILLHSSVAGAGQWRRLMADLAPAHRAVAVNLFGYGATPPWDGTRPQTLADQADLAAHALPPGDAPVAVVGHSFGGSVAMELARQHPTRVTRLALVEPNPFYLLAQSGRQDSYQEALDLRAHINRAAQDGDWSRAAQAFATYWTGPGSWDAMPPDRQAKFAAALRPNLWEWDAVIGETTPLADWSAALPHRTTVISARDTVRTIRHIVEEMRRACPHWQFDTLPEGGHMAPLSHPALVNPRIMAALRD